MRRDTVDALAVLALAATSLGTAPTALADAAGPGLRERVIVELRAYDQVGTVAAAEQGRGARIEARYDTAVAGFAASMTPARVAALRADPRVARIVPDVRIRKSAAQTDPPWGLDRIDQRTRDLDGMYSPAATGAGVTVFVVDSGVLRDHGDLAGRVAGGVDFFHDDLDPTDCDGHGTHVAATVAGSRYGVAKAATVVPLRVLDCHGDGYLSDAIDAFDWILRHRPAGPSVVNFSVGGPANSVVDAAVERLVAAGTPVVVSAGNDDVDACTTSPGRTRGALTVGATGRDDRRAWFSNYGACVDLFAPGVGILSAGITSTTDAVELNGTSMAAPHVAGAVALWQETHPGSTSAQVTAGLHAAATHDVVLEARSAHDELLYTGSAPQPVPTPVPPAPVLPSASGTVTPAVLSAGPGATAFTVDVTTTVPVLDRLTGWARSTTATGFGAAASLSFGNPSGDRVHWRATGTTDGSWARGGWTVTDLTGLAADAAGVPVVTTFPLDPTLSFQVTEPVVPASGPPPVATAPPPAPDPAPTTPSAAWTPAPTPAAAPTRPVSPTPAPSKPAPAKPKPKPKPKPAPAVDHAIQIVQVRWDAPGRDTSADASLNGEYVRVRNTSGHKVTLAGYTLRDGQRHVFRFPSITLRPGATLTIRTGRGRASATTLYWRSRTAVWGNSADVAQVRDSRGRATDTVRWSAAGRGYRSF